MIATRVPDTATTAPLLTNLSDERLLSRLGELTVRERRITLRILDHLNEVEHRGLFLKEGFSSMFAYCTRTLGYSESAANRRIRTARCIRRFPVVRERLERNRVNLSTVSIVAGLFTQDNCAELLARIEGCSQDTARAIVAEYRPRAAVRDQIRPVCLTPAAARNAAPRSSREAAPPSVQALNPTLACAPAAEPVEGGEHSRDHRRSGGKNSATQPGGQPDEGNSPTAVVGSATIGAGSTADARPAADTGGNEAAAVRDDGHEQRYIVRFAAGSELVRRIEAARSLLSFRLPANASLEDILGAVLDEFIDHNDPSRRAARRVKREGRAKRKEERERKRKDTAVARNPRAIPAAVRDRVIAEADGRCQYVSRRGRRCDATAFLQVDHIVPVARGGTADPANLRVLCARHNRSEAARLLGREGGRGRNRAGRGETGRRARNERPGSDRVPRSIADR